MNARYDDSFVRRFVSADVIVPSLKDPQSYNRYAYARNNPVKYIDPDGNGRFLVNGRLGWFERPLLRWMVLSASF